MRTLREKFYAAHPYMQNSSKAMQDSFFEVWYNGYSAGAADEEQRNKEYQEGVDAYYARLYWEDRAEGYTEDNGFIVALSPEDLTRIGEEYNVNSKEARYAFYFHTTLPYTKVRISKELANRLKNGQYLEFGHLNQFAI